MVLCIGIILLCLLYHATGFIRILNFSTVPITFVRRADKEFELTLFKLFKTMM